MGLMWNRGMPDKECNIHSRVETACLILRPHFWYAVGGPVADLCSLAQMFATAQKTTELWMWKMEYLHHEQRPLYFGEWF